MTKVLIVDDEDLLTTAYRMGLEKAGFKVFTANRSNIAIELLQREKVDFIFLDMLMPDMNGIEFMKKINKDGLSKGAKIIAFSNIENPAVVSACKKLGAIDYLLKVNYTPAQTAEYIKGLIKKK